MQNFKERSKILQQSYDSWSKGEEVWLTRNDVEEVPAVEEVPVVVEEPVVVKEHPAAEGNFDAIRMPPAMRKRGRPNGSERTVIGLPKK